MLRKTSLVVFASFLIPASVAGQFLHDARRAQKSEDTLKTAREVTSGALFEKQLENLDRLRVASTARVFESAEVAMRRRMLSLRRWQSYPALFDALEKEIGQPKQVTKVELDRTLEEVTAKIGAAKKSFAQLKEELEQRAKSFDAELVSTWLARIGKLDDLEEQVARLKLPAELSSTQQGILSEISSTATELAALYGAFSATLPPTVDMPLLQAQMQLLKAEETHLKTLGLIAAKRDADLADMQNILQLARNQFQKGLTEQQRSRDVATTVQLLIDEARAAREEFLKTKTDENEARLERSESDLRIVLSLLLNVSALAARGDTPARLALLRQAEEARRHSIRVSAIATGSYEQILVNGAARLALYYQGGLQPETLARLLNALATFGLIPAVLVN